MKKICITGGAGFFGEILKKEFVKKGYLCVSIDLEKDYYNHDNFVSIQGDIRNIELLNEICSSHDFIAIFHCAAILGHDAKDKDFLWTSNVDGTQNIVEIARKYSIPKIIFTSSNCLWGENLNRPVIENDTPHPVEIYGESKLEAEKILLKNKDHVDSVIFRCPTIIDEGRLGLLAILFEFIKEGRKVWVVGKGDNLYQFIYAKDLVNAFKLALNFNGTEVFNIGSDNVVGLRDAYNYVIKKSGTKAKVASLPEKLSKFGMKLAYKLNISPLGPYHYKMINESFIFDTTKIKNILKWMPTLTNEEMLYKSYKYFEDNFDEIKNRKDVSAHKQVSKMGIIRFLKWIS